MNRSLSRALPRVLLVLTGLMAPNAATALPVIDPEEPNPPCVANRVVHVSLRRVGFNVIGARIDIDASDLKLVDEGCGPPADQIHELGSWLWSLEGPPGSSAALDGTSTLLTGFTPDVAGDYAVELVVCPAGCAVPLVSGGVQEVAPYTRSAQLHVLESLTIPPETRPILPPSARVRAPTAGFTAAELDEKCLRSGGVVEPQWVTVNDWPGEYALLEGWVASSAVSRKDSPLNHDSQDFNFAVSPDGPFNGLLAAEPEDGLPRLGVEWETNHYPKAFRPALGDRVSVWGLWIHDCGHPPFYTEIHPPVGVAVHRPRPIALPEGEVIPLFGDVAGSNIFFPGIVTDIWFHDRAGEITRNCSWTGLHTPGHFGPLLPGAIEPGHIEGDCVQEPFSFAQELRPFRIYLPRSPQQILAAAGVAAPPVPLYWRVYEHPDYPGGPDPVIVRREEPDPLRGGEIVTYLEVSLDLAGVTGQYARRIVAGWVYPDPDNWGLSEWRVRVTQLDVHDDGDGSLRGDGDWNLWLGLSNARPEAFGTQEYVKIIGCDGCVHGPNVERNPLPPFDLIRVPAVYGFSGRPWSTGPAGLISPDRWLGPDLRLWPNRPDSGLYTETRIRVHASGFESDDLNDDNAGLIEDSWPQIPFDYVRFNTCTPGSANIPGVSWSGCVRYQMHYSVQEVGPVGPATLSKMAETQHSRYTLSAAQHGDIISALALPIRPDRSHPEDAVIAGSNQPARSFADFPSFRPQPRETNALTDITVADFYDEIVAGLVDDPQQVDEALNELREEIEDMLHGPRAEEVLLDLPVIRAALPPELWERHFGSLPTAEPDPAAPTTRMIGAGPLPEGGGSAAYTFDLHCAQLRLPNSLAAHFGGHRFELELVTGATCEPVPPQSCGGPAASGAFLTHAGTGIGRLDGQPGASAEWKFVDGACGRQDRIELHIRDGQGTTALAISRNTGAPMHRALPE